MELFFQVVNASAVLPSLAHFFFLFPYDLHCVTPQAALISIRFLFGFFRPRSRTEGGKVLCGGAKRRHTVQGTPKWEHASFPETFISAWSYVFIIRVNNTAVSF